MEEQAIAVASAYTDDCVGSLLSEDNWPQHCDRLSICETEASVQLVCCVFESQCIVVDELRQNVVRDIDVGIVLMQEALS